MKIFTEKGFQEELERRRRADERDKWVEHRLSELEKMIFELRCRIEANEKENIDERT